MNTLKKMNVNLQEVIEDNEKEEIRNYFENKKNGIFVDVGGNEPRSKYSQSWHLESILNWTGLIVEPNPSLANKAMEERPGSIVCECASTSPEKTGETEFYIPLLDGAEKTGHASLEINVDEHNYKEHKVIKVKTTTLSALLEKHNIEKIDFLSIDVEGMEMDVLLGLDFNKYKPSLILMEDKHLYLNKHRFLKKMGYILMKRANENCWYVPRGAKTFTQPMKTRMKLMKRLYLSIWLRKLKYAMRHKSLKPFKTL
ncbi:FkbM family methyltransferase [Thermodesulfobacteriota bacterium]